MNDDLTKLLIPGAAAILAATIAAAAVLITNWLNRKAEDHARQDERAHQQLLRADERTHDERTRSLDNEAWFQRALYEKQLTAVQEGYSWAMKLHAEVEKSSVTPSEDQIKAVYQMANNARDWYDMNVLFLNGNFPQSSTFVGMINSSDVYIRDRGNGHQFWHENFNATLEFLRRRAAALMARESDRTTI